MTIINYIISILIFLGILNGNNDYNSLPVEQQQYQTNQITSDLERDYQLLKPKSLLQITNHIFL